MPRRRTNGKPAKLTRRPALSSNQPAGSARTIGWGLLRQATGISLTSIVFGAGACFGVCPRWEVKRDEIATSEPLRSVGFSKRSRWVIGRGRAKQRRGDARSVLPPRRCAAIQVAQRAVVPRRRGDALRRRVVDPAAPTRGGAASRRSRNRTSAFTSRPSRSTSTSCRAFFPVFAIQSDPRLKISHTGDQLFRQEDNREGKRNSTWRRPASSRIGSGNSCRANRRCAAAK